MHFLNCAGWMILQQLCVQYWIWKFQWEQTYALKIKLKSRITSQNSHFILKNIVVKQIRSTKTHQFVHAWLWEIGILLPKLFWPTVKKKCSSYREKLLKFEIKGWEFANFLRSLNTFTTYLSSLLGVIAIVFSNHAQKWQQIYCKSVQLVRVSSFRNDKIHTLVGFYLVQ